MSSQQENQAVHPEDKPQPEESRKQDTGDHQLNDMDFIPKDTGWAWMCCLGCFLQNSLTVGGVLRSFGVYYVAFMKEFDSKAGTTGWIAVLSASVLLSAGSFANALAIKFGSRAVVCTGGMIICAGYIASMFATRVEHLYLTYGLIIGLGCSLSWSVSLAHLGQYFKRRRAVAFAFAASGVGVGNLIFPPIMTICTDTYGLRGSLLVMAGVSLNVCVAGALLRPASAYRPKQKEQERIAYQNHKDIVFVDTKKSENRSRLSTIVGTLNFFKSFYRMYSLLEWSLLKKRCFVLYCISIAFYFAGNPSYFNITPAHAEQIGHSENEAAFLVSLAGLGQLVGRLGTGFLADSHILPTYVIMAAGVFVCVFAIVITPFVTNLIALGSTVFVYAVHCGPAMVLHPVLLGETFGMHRLNSTLGISGIFMAAGIPLSTSIAGILRDATGDWKASYWYTAAVMFLCGSFMLLRPVAIKADERRAHTDEVQSHS